MVTVLTVAVAATLAVAATATVAALVTTTRSDAAVRYAEIALDDLLDRYVTELARDATRWETVAFYERPRICRWGDGSQIPAAPDTPRADDTTPWPVASCGWAWEYPAPDPAWPAPQLEVHPPSPDDGRIRLEARTLVDGSWVTRTRWLDRPGPEDWTVTAGGDLTANRVWWGSAGGSVSGARVLTGGVLDASGGSLDTDGVSPSGWTVTAWGGVTNPPSPTWPSTRWLTGPGTSDPEGTPGDATATAAGPPGSPAAEPWATTHSGCPTATPAEDTTAGLVGWVCVAPGAAVRTTTGPVTVPETTRAVLVMPRSSTLIDLWVTPVDVDPTVCTTAGCSMVAAADADNTAGRHPGWNPDLSPGGGPGAAAGNIWDSSGGTYLGAVRWPADGVIRSTVDVVFGLCGTGFRTSGGTCVTYGSAGSPGVRVDRALTVIAGTPERAAHLWVGGPVWAGPTGTRVALAATGEVRIPHWARPPGGTLTVEAVLVGATVDGADLSPGETTVTGGVRLWPAGMSGHADNTSTLVKITGSVAAGTVDLYEPAWGSVRVTPPGVRPGRPPWLWGWGTWR